MTIHAGIRFLLRAIFETGAQGTEDKNIINIKSINVIHLVRIPLMRNLAITEDWGG